MKKTLILSFVLCVSAAYAAGSYLDTENRLWFNADVVKNAIVEFVPESKQQPVADLYQDLMDQTTGKISVDSLFKVCRKAGFNTYKYEGFTQCKSFIQKMLMDAEVAQSVDLNGFCPGLDEKGNNPNKLRSITDKTRIGDFCSSTNIRMGQVIFKPGYNCSCMASVCNHGFEFQGGACVTRIADGNGDCLREAHPKTSENNYLEKCKSFCEKKYAGRACKYTSVVMSHSTGQCICNPNSTEIDAAYESMQRAEDGQINSLKYYAVCGDQRGKSGGTETCVEGVFNWVNVGRLQAAGLAEEYARVRHNDTVHCDTVNIDTRYNDDYVKCTSRNSKRYYEFQFDDVKESSDSSIQQALVLGICKIHNVPSGVSKVIGGYAGPLKCNTACTSEMLNTAHVFGLNATSSGNNCGFSGLSMTAAEAESKLAKIDGIDNYVFFHGIQIQGSQNVISQLRQYIKSTGKTVRTFDCNKNVGEIKNSLLVGDDDVLRCKLNGQPIDFVFEDFSESWLYVQEVDEGKIQCIVSGGKFAGQECYGLDEKQCTDANATYLKQNPGASGFRWDGKECVSLDANEAQFYDGAIQVGTGAVALVDCVFGTKLGCVLVMVESTSLVAEMTTGVAIENRAGDFLALATRCNDRNCAINILRNDAGRVLSVKDVMDATSLNSVDQGLAHLVDKLEPEDLSGVSDGDWDAIVTQLGGDPEDASGTALVVLNKIGLIGQFASVGASGLRLTAQAITKLAGRGSRIGHTASTVARALDTTGDAARAANNASDAARAANNTADASRATNSASDVLHTDINAYRNAANKQRARAKYHPDKFETQSDEIKSMALYIFTRMDDIDKMSDDELRALSRVMDEFDTKVAAASAAAADATRAVDDVADTADIGTDVMRISDESADVSRTTNNASDAGRATNATADAARTTSRTTNTAVDGTRMFGRTNVDDIGMVDKGWERAVFDGVDRFRHKKITYPEEADDVRRALEATKGQHNLAYMGVKDGYIVIAYESDLERAWPAFNRAVSGAADAGRATNATADAARTTSRTTNAVTDGTRMFGRTNVDDIGMVDKGWERAVFDGVDRFRHKKITYPEEADDVRRALEATKGQHNLAYMGVKDGYIVIAYESDLERAWPAFNRAVSGAADAGRATDNASDTNAFTILEDGTIVRPNAVDVVTDTSVVTPTKIDIISPSRPNNTPVMTDWLDDAEAVESEFIDLWHAYAPKNQTLQDFKDMADGDIVKMRNMTRGWSVHDYDSLIAIEQGDFTRLYNKRPDILEYIGVNGFDAAAEQFPEVRAILDRSNARQIEGTFNVEFEKMLDEYFKLKRNMENCAGDPKCIKDANLKLAQKRVEMNNTPGFKQYIESSAGGNYSTFNPQLKEVNDYKKLSNQVVSQAETHIQALQDADKRKDELKNMLDATKEESAQFIISQMADAVSSSNIKQVAAQRAAQLKNIVDSNPRFTRLKETYSTLTPQQRVAFAQELSDELLKANNINFSIPVHYVDYSGENTLGGLVSYSNNKYKLHMKFDPNKLPTFADFANTIAHEIGGHGIDKLVPNKSALGAQMSDIGRGVLSGERKYYYLKPTEQEAYAIGDKVEEVFRAQ